MVCVRVMRSTAISVQAGQTWLIANCREGKRPSPRRPCDIEYGPRRGRGSAGGHPSQAYWRAHFPNVDVYAEKGSGIDTLVGLGLTDLTVSQLVTGTSELFTRDGDINQEDITNDAVNAWTAMNCWHFCLTDNPGVNHFELPSNPDVLARLIADANAPRSNCPVSSAHGG
jgi:hypothetical protein